MNRLFLQPGCVLTLLLAATPGVAQVSGLNRAASVTGLVRDSEGVPQMGARVEALLPDATVVGTAITDSRGRYRFLLQPGNYRIRATAALLMPTIRERLQVLNGSRSVVDLTLSTLLAPDGWLPVSRRTRNEPSDDWTWTLRSSASRSILRLTDGEDTSTSDVPPQVVAVSSSRQEARRGATAGSVSLKESDGGFARGGSHNVLLLARVNEDGSGAVLRADLSGTRSPYPVAPSAEISAGLQKQTLLNGRSRLIVSYSSHPELLDSRGGNGLQAVTVRSGQRMELGDLVRVDVGSVLRNSNLHGNAFAMEPFLRVAARSGSGVVVAYSLTHARDTESLDDLDQAQAALPVPVLRNGHLRQEGGTHQAFSIEGQIPGGGTAAIALYRDSMVNPLLSGTGQLSSVEQHMDGLIADPTTRTFRIAAHDYRSGGLRVAYRHPLGKSAHAGVEFSSGEALRASGQKNARISDVLSGLTPTSSYVASAYLDGRVPRTGTTVRATYRWQPAHTLTAVDAFHMDADGAYLSCSMRQSLSKLHFVPRGLEALVDVQNLLAEGYQPFVSNDGQTLYLAQTPRMLQAGLSFSF